MREIKFRAFVKDSPDKEIYKDNTMYGWDDVVDDLNWFIKCGGLQEDSFVLMQYTGLKDKNGKEIYEDDLLILDTSMIYGEQSPLRVIYEKSSFTVNGVTNLDDHLLNVSKYYKIIGNIYENPELINQHK